VILFFSLRYSNLVIVNITSEISFIAVLHDHINIVGSLLDVIQLDDVLVVAGAQDFDFILEQFLVLALEQITFSIKWDESTA
jgi:hypothetical protein